MAQDNMMLKERALVIDLIDDQVLLQVDNKSSCNRCSSKSGCGVNLMASALGSHHTKTYNLSRSDSVNSVASNLDVKIGDKVLIGVEESVLIQGAILMYLVPIMSMIIAGVIGNYCSLLLGIEHEFISILFSLAGFVYAVLMTRYGKYSQIIQQRIQPQILDVIR